MPETKRALHSRTIWSGLLAIAAGLLDLLLAVLYFAGVSDEPIPPDRLSTALLAIVGGVGAIWGRLTATERIERPTR